MNQYGQRVREYWQTFRPAQFEAMAPPQREVFLEAEAQRLAERIQNRQRQLQGQAPPNEDYADAIGRAKTARFNAEQEIFAEEFPAQPTGPAPTQG